ncbi:hypothetical protein Tco_1526177 [Tanacetum coccineum]
MLEEDTTVGVLVVLSPASLNVIPLALGIIEGAIVAVLCGGTAVVEGTANQEPLSEDILGVTIKRDTRSYYPKRYWEILPKEILGDTTQRDIGRYYPKRYWEILPKEILGDTTQRDIGRYYPKRYWEILPKEILGDTTQRDIQRCYPKRY